MIQIKSVNVSMILNSDLLNNYFFLSYLQQSGKAL